MRKPSRRERIPLRRGVQAAFLALCGWIGVEFYLFMRWGASLEPVPFPGHPPGAEGFLPISALLSLKYWAATGRICELHPAGLFIFLAILAVAFLLRKAFCSWLCPVGTLSEGLGLLGKRIFGRSFDPPRWLDLPLRALKYLLLLFFLWVTAAMGGPALEGFLYSPFNAAADIRMYGFFADLSVFALAVLVILAVLSLLVRDVWCRYLCPYGALLGLLSLASPLGIRRSKDTCIDCEKCTKACPSRIQVHKAGRVFSDACTGCYQCVEACPVQDTLAMRAPGGKAVPPWVFALLVAGVFAGITGLAMATGHWRSSLVPGQYQFLIRMGQTGSPR